jgi:nicotinamidase-related amidase
MRNGETTSAETTRRTALLLVDVINDMDFEGSESLVRCAEPMARRLHELKRRCRAAGIPTLYINDNFGKWRSARWWSTASTMRCRAGKWRGC